MVMMATTHRMLLGHRPTRDRLCTIRGRLGIAGRLRYATRCRLSLRRRCCRFLGSRISAGRSLIGLVRRVGGALFWSRLIRRTSCKQREG
ncbi:MAG: hypothetical protein WCA22_14555 [Candidatus Binatus sp.]